MAADTVGRGHIVEIMVDFGEEREQTAVRQRIVGSDGSQFAEVDLADEEIMIFITLVVDIHRIVRGVRQVGVAPEA